MKIRLLAQGSTKWQRLIKHWGLSILIDEDILFDAFGQPGYVIKQFKRFDEDIRKIKHIVISHDDWDHVAGLWKILELNRDVAVYVCPGFKPEIKERIRWYGARLVEVKGVTNIRDDIYASGELEGRRGNMNIAEQYLAIKTKDEMTIITGCAHPGIIEIVRHAATAFDKGACTVLGGFHLKDKTAQEMSDIILRLKERGIRRVIPFHCTGRLAQEMLIKEYKNECIIPAEGQAVEI